MKFRTRGGGAGIERENVSSVSFESYSLEDKDLVCLNLVKRVAGERECGGLLTDKTRIRDSLPADICRMSLRALMQRIPYLSRCPKRAEVVFKLVQNTYY